MMRAYERLLRYVKIHTTSDPDSESCPSTACQFDLARALVEEMKSIGIADAFTGTEVLEMRASDIGNDGNIGFGKTGKIRDYSIMLHSHFQKKRKVIGIEPQHSQR